MKYKRNDDQVLIRVDKGEEILQVILKVCEEEKIYGGIFSGIGACCKVEVSTFIPEENSFLIHELEGMLEVVSLNGNISLENGKAFEHTHALFSYLENGEHKVLAGHLKSAVVSYTAEILMTVTEPIDKVLDRDVGITVWDI